MSRLHPQCRPTSAAQGTTKQVQRDEEQEDEDLENAMETFLREQAERESGSPQLRQSRPEAFPGYILRSATGPLLKAYCCAGGALAQSKIQEEGKEVGVDVVSDAVSCDAATLLVNGL